MEVMRANDSEVTYQEITNGNCEIDVINDILVNTKVDKVILIHGISGPKAIVTLNQFINAHKEDIILYVLKSVSDGTDYLQQLNKISNQCNVMICVGFADISFWTGEPDMRLLVYRNDQYIDFLSRLEAWRAGAFMSGVNGDQVCLEIFADCFEGCKNDNVLDFMKQMDKTLGRGGFSTAIMRSLENADRIGKYTAVKSSVFGN